MNNFFVNLFLPYMLVPLLAILGIVLMVIIAKKNQLLSNKKLILYVLIAIILLGIPGLLSIMGYLFMPWMYIVLQIMYFILGWANVRLINKIIPELSSKPYILEALIIIVIMIGGCAIFSVLFNLIGELNYGLAACTCILPFFIASLFKQAYKAFVAIPIEIYNVWTYDMVRDMSGFDWIDYSNMMVLELELQKQQSDRSPSKIKVKAPAEIDFGSWFRKFIEDYNLKYPANPIESHDETEPYGWIFYYKPSLLKPRRYVDYDMSIVDNKIKERHTIIAKRVKQQDL